MGSSKRLKRASRLVKLTSWGVLGTLLLSIGSAYFPFSMVLSAHARIAEQQEELEKARQAPGQLRALQQQLERTHRELAFLERGVTDREYIPTMLKQIEETARERKMKIVAVRPQVQTQQNTNQSGNKSGQQSSSSKAYEEQLIEISLQGDFWNLVSFLKQLDVYPKILAVQTMQVQAKTNPAQPVKGNPDLDVKMTVKAFIFRNSGGGTAPSPNSASRGG